jgi:hypothetical protein
VPIVRPQILCRRLRWRLFEMLANARAMDAGRRHGHQGRDCGVLALGVQQVTSHKRVAPPDDPSRALVKGIAMDIGKEVVAYVERQYPQAVSAASSTFRLSLRNCIYNQIIAALEVTDEAEILARLARRKKERRELKKMVDIVRDTDWEAFRAKRDGESGQ